MTFGFEEFDGIDPRTAAAGKYRIPRSRLSDIGMRHGGRKLHDFHNVVWLCESPVHAFQGIRHFDDAFCAPLLFREFPDATMLLLCGIPKERRLSESITVPPIPDHTFCVVVDSKLEVWNWLWFQSDENSPQLPDKYELRFDEKIWPTIEKSTY